MAAFPDPVDLTQTESLRGLRAREEWAWERLQRLALDRVYAYLLVRCGRREEAEDLAAEVFVAAVAHAHRFRGEAAPVTWLIGIARRKLADARRRRLRRPEVLETELGALAERVGEAAAAPHAALERREAAAALRRAVLELPEAQREALLLRCVDQLSLRETAQVLRRSEGAVKALLHRAKAAVLARLQAAEAPVAPQENAHVEPSR